MSDPERRDLIGTLAHRDLPDGRSLYVMPLTYDRARLAIGPTGALGYDRAW